MEVAKQPVVRRSVLTQTCVHLCHLLLLNESNIVSEVEEEILRVKSYEYFHISTLKNYIVIDVVGKCKQISIISDHFNRIPSTLPFAYVFKKI